MLIEIILTKIPHKPQNVIFAIQDSKSIIL